MPNETPTQQIPFNPEHDFEYAQLETVSPLIRRITARNPSGFTFHGTGTYVIGKGRVAVIDPGPMIEEHIEALKTQLKDETVTHLLITHTHIDHSPAAAPLKAYWQAPTLGYGPHGSGRSSGRSSGKSSGGNSDKNSRKSTGKSAGRSVAGNLETGLSIEEGGDLDFMPDIVVRHGDLIHGDGWTLECVHTPGHTSNHLCFALQEEQALFTGDHVMGWSTSVISPPDGDMTSYMESLELLLERNEDTYWPTHGSCIKDVKNYVRAFIEHRLARERQILACLDQGISRISDMVPVIYKDTDQRLYAAAARSVLAAILRLIDIGKVAVKTGSPGLDADFVTHFVTRRSKKNF